MSLIPEQSLLIILLNKEAYKSYKDLIDLTYIKETFRELSFLYTTLIALHEQYDKDITFDELSVAFWTKYPDADKLVYTNMLQRLSELKISPEVGQGTLLAVKLRKGALKLSEKAYRVAQGLDDVASLEKFYNEEFSGVEKIFNSPLDAVSTNLEELIEQNYAASGLRWRLDCLNKSLGSLRKGDFGFIFARPESGKTTFLASEVTQFLCGGMGAPVVWFNNEEQGTKVMLRIYQAFFGVTSDQLLASPRRFREEFAARTGDKFKLFDSATIGRGDVESIVERYQPELVIYDQIDKIKGFNNDRDDLRLGSIYQWARELAKGSHAAIGVCQADGHGEGVRYLTMEHVANAKTSKQAEADFIIGIGKASDPQLEAVRYLTISKNKLLGDKDTRAELRHGRFDVLIKPEIARYEDIIKFD
jgi:replicative DNA helicase